MRSAFIKSLVELAKQDERILLLTGDLGFTVVEVFADQFPGRFINIGVAEQNMVGIATGLAEAGYIPFVYSIVPFAVLRPYEFIRNGPILHHLPVRLVGVGAGFDYGHAGFTHYGLEDVGVLRIQPGISIITPADPEQARQALLKTWSLPGPVYYRLSKNNGTLPGLEGRFEVGVVEMIREGSDLVILGMGEILHEALKAAEAFQQQGVSCAVGVVSDFSPETGDRLKSLLRRYPLVATIEAHYRVGGLGSWLAEIRAETNAACRLVTCGVENFPDGISGSSSYLQALYGLSAENLVAKIQQALPSKGSKES